MYYASPQFNLLEIHVGVALHFNRCEFSLPMQQGKPEMDSESI